MEDPSDGGDATSAALKGAAASVKPAKDATSPSPAPVKPGECRPDLIEFHGFTHLPVAKSEGVALSLEAPAAHTSPAPGEEIQFDGFSELPVAKAEGVVKSEGVALSLEAHPAHITLKGSGCEEAILTKSNKLKRGCIERGDTDSPKRSKHCIDDTEVKWMLYGCLDKNAENVNNSKETFKRTVADGTSDDSDSPPKRTRVESIRRAMAAVTGGDIQDDISQDTDTADTLVAASPIDHAIKLGRGLRRLAKSIKERAKALDKWEGSLNKREGSLDKREASIDKREASIDKRETSVEKFEGLAAKRLRMTQKLSLPRVVILDKQLITP